MDKVEAYYQKIKKTVMKLNLGCGAQVVDGWVNVDYSIGAFFFKVPMFSYLNRKMGIFNLDWDESIFLHDLTKKFPWSTSSVDVIYSSHTLEHLDKEQGRRFLGEAFRILKTGGVLRIIVPDINYYITAYRDNLIFADDFVDKLGVKYPTSGNVFKKKY